MDRQTHWQQIGGEQISKGSTEKGNLPNPEQGKQVSLLMPEGHGDTKPTEDVKNDIPLLREAPEQSKRDKKPMETMST